jgi:hypothetical protein
MTQERCSGASRVVLTERTALAASPALCCTAKPCFIHRRISAGFLSADSAPETVKQPVQVDCN